MRSDRSRTRNAGFELLILILALCISHSPGLEADDGLTNAEGLGPFLQATVEEQADPQLLWSKLLESDLVIDSEMPAAQGRFDFVLIGGLQPPYVRLIADANDSGAHVLMLGPRNLPYAALLGEVQILYGLENGWQHKLEGWTLSLDEFLADNYMNNSAPHKRDGHIRLDVGGLLRHAFRTDEQQIRPATVRWIREMQTLALEKGNGTRAMLRFHTPIDQQRFGTALAEVTLVSKNHIHMRLTGFQREPNVLRIAPDEPKSLVATVGAAPVKIDLVDFHLSANATGKTFAESMTLWNELFPVEFHDPRPLLSTQQALLGVKFREELLAAAAVWQNVVLARVSGGEVPDGVSRLMTSLIHELGLARLHASFILSGGEQAFPVDDPALLWTGFELAVSPALAKALIQKVCLATIQPAGIPIQLQLQMAEAFGRLGRPPWIIAVEEASDLEEDRLCNALLKSCWQFELSESDVETCVNFCHDDRPFVRHAAIQTLVRSGALNRIPREHLDEWFDSHIAIPVTSPSLKMQQKIALQELSVHRTGRVYLLEQLAADDASPQLASEIGGILAYRAAAARALQRYDFMSLAEMQQILRTLVAHDELIKSGAEPSD